MKTRKQLTLAQQVSTQDQVTNFREKGIPAIFLGSAQLDKKNRIKCFAERIVSVTPEWISKAFNKSKLQDLASKYQLSLTAIDEAHLIHQWQKFRPARIQTLKDEFLQIYIMLLMATVPPEVQSELQSLASKPLH